ncbi:MAG TPA: hypothetical protein VJM12_02310 [Pyrinomonadaceae bacterium]|nr:hypothetical protein [Pyrinomonadaceae bacterium]
MNARQSTTHRFALSGVIAFLLVVLGACQYSVPITERPTRNVDNKLIGDWASAHQGQRLKIRSLTNNTYIVSYSGFVFQAFHSDISGVPFLSVQELETDARSYSYLIYRVSEDGTKLYLRLVNDEILRGQTSSTKVVQKVLKQNLQNPALLHHEDEFTKVQ